MTRSDGYTPSLWRVQGRAGPARVDVAVATGFVAAALGEAVVLHENAPALMGFAAGGAPLLMILALRRTRPLLPIWVIAAGAVLGSAIQTMLWPGASDGGGVWLFALMFAAYSLGLYGPDRALALGAALPLLVVLLIDLPIMSGWPLVSGVLFVTTFVGLLPTAVGRVVRVRRDRLAALAQQRELILREQRAQRRAAVLAERLRTTERLQPALLNGLRAIAEQAESGADPGQVEQAARHLLGRTREEVVSMTAPVEVPEPVYPATADHLSPLRAAAQRWIVLGAGVITAGLALESTTALQRGAWVAVAASGVVGLSLALAWWRPLLALLVAWAVTAGLSRLVVPLDGTLAETGLALAAAFVAAALCSRRAAVAGLALCLLGQLLGVGTADPVGEGVMIAVCWLGGVVLNEVSRLVEQSRLNNRVLADQHGVEQQRAAVQERLRLAREVHDQAGHSLTVVALQAGAARRLAATDPVRAREVMATVVGAARQGLTVMTGEGTTDLDALLDHTRAAGLRLTADVSALHDPELLAPETWAAAFRTVQEALTNVLRHAPGASAAVTAHREGLGLVITIRNGPSSGAASAPGSRRGLSGLRDRVTACAGELHWGPRTDGGFEVRAVLPARVREGAAG